MTKLVNKSSSIRSLDLFMKDGLLRVGCRLRHSSIEAGARNPTILPKKAHVVDLLVRLTTRRRDILEESMFLA